MIFSYLQEYTLPHVATPCTPPNSQDRLASACSCRGMVRATVQLHELVKQSNRFLVIEGGKLYHLMPLVDESVNHHFDGPYVRRVWHHVMVPR